MVTQEKAIDGYSCGRNDVWFRPGATFDRKATEEDRRIEYGSIKGASHAN